MTGPRPGQSEMPEPGLRRILANNPSAMTQWGTNTYIVGQGRVAIIDPGPADPAHQRAIMAALGRHETVAAIFVTHSHIDHSPLARPLAEATGAPVLAFGDSLAGRSRLMRELAARGLASGGEGVDTHFRPDERLEDGQGVSIGDWSLTALWTPGHFGNHLCFVWEDAVFTGDHIMGWASSLVSPPDGDLGAYMASTSMLAARNDRIFYSGHGAPVTAPKDRCNWLIAHRNKRENDILSVLATGPATISEITTTVYTDINPVLLGAARRNVFAHLIDLVQKSQARPDGDLTVDARYHRI